MILREPLFYGQQRIDLPVLRSLASSVQADFDVLAGSIMAGGQGLVVSGFYLITTGAVGASAESLVLNVQDGLLMHPLASEAGTIYSVPADRITEALTASNSKITGSWTANTVNYVGLDLRRTADSTTADIQQFYDPNTETETAERVPLARTLDYVLIITTQDFSSFPGILPLAKVTLDSSLNVTVLEDARNMMFRLGSGGAVPDIYNKYTWPGLRSEIDEFNVGDKVISSQKDWQNAIMTRLWEIGGGEFWYSATADRNVRLARLGTAPMTNGEWFEWDGTDLHWSDLRFLFDNSTGYYNDVTDQLTDSPGLTDLADGDCLYVDLDRTQNATVTAVKTAWNTLGTPDVPGSRYILAWRSGTTVYTRDSSFPVGATFTVASETNLGLVQLTYAAGNPAIPLVAAQDANGTIKNTATGGNGSGLEGTGQGTGAGLVGTGGATTGSNALILNQNGSANIGAMAKFKDSLGSVRTVIDHLGFPTGRYFRWEELWDFYGTGLSVGTLPDSRITWDDPVGSAGFGFSTEDSDSSIWDSSTGKITANTTTTQETCVRTTKRILTIRDYTSLAAEWEMTLSSATPDLNISVGLFHTVVANDMNTTAQIAFRKTSGTANWLASSGATASVTTTASGVSPVANTRQRFRIEYNGSNSIYAAATANFYINGNLVATRTNLPPQNGATSTMYFAIRARYNGSNSTDTISIGPVRIQWNAQLSSDVV